MVQLMHYQAVNLARRLSSKNENDLLQESYYDIDDEDKVSYTKDLCSQIAQHVLHPHNLPAECMKYTDLVQKLRSQEKDMNDPSSLMS
mmetsp:Transcript_2377/g.2882  ORF Transcript_2377/g.2882 Transcript_2377/m.2882 type:complete len:88 (+) Transcript_2377:344-607(+)